MNVKKRLFSIFLILTLTLTTVFVGAEGVFADSVKLPESIPAKGESFADAALMKAADDTTAITAITAVSLNSSQHAQLYNTGEYDAKGIYFPVEIPSAGNFVFEVLSVGDTYVYLYDSVEPGAAYIDYLGIPSAADTSDVKRFSVQVSKPGIYYLVFQSASSYSKAQSAFAVNYAAAVKTTSSIKLTSGKERFASVAGSSYRYYKITTPGTRYLTIDMPWGDGGDSSVYKIKLMDSKKKKNLLKGVVTLQNEGRGYTTYVGVPKGTYYVAVSTSSDTCYSLKVTSSKVDEKSGSTRSKANKISKGNVRKGVITATQSSTSGDWYKIVLNSSQKVSLQIKTKSGGYSGGIKMSVYSGSKTKPFGTAEHYYGDPDGVWDLTTQYNGDRLAKGTYYIKISKYGSSSGFYELKWL